MEKAEKDYGIGGSGAFKVKDGANKMRLVSECVPYSSTYMGNPTFKFVCHILDRTDGKVKLYFMPVTVFKAIEALQTDPDYMFETVPMPYDITINAKNAGTKEVEYTVTPARTNTELTEEELYFIDNVKPINEIVEKLMSKELPTIQADEEITSSE